MSDTLKLRPLVQPVITLHGTHADSLVDDLMDIVHSLRGLKETLAKAVPHGRDYADADQFIAARDAWHDRRWAVEAMLLDFEQYGYEIVQTNMTAGRTMRNVQ